MPYWSEKLLERRLGIEIKKRGGRAVKFTSPGNRGVPDRKVLLPGGWVDYIELKSTGEKPDKLQLWWHKELKRLGFRVYVIDTLPGLYSYLALTDSLRHEL